MNFTIGKIPARVHTFEVAGDLTIMECINYAVTKNVLQYAASDKVYLNGAEVSDLTVVPTSPCVILLDVPSVKGAQIVVKVGIKGKEMESFAVRHGDTIGDVLKRTGILENVIKIYMNGRTSIITDTITRNSEIVVELIDEITDSSCRHDNVSEIIEKIGRYIGDITTKLNDIHDALDTLPDFVNDTEELDKLMENK